MTALSPNIASALDVMAASQPDAPAILLPASRGPVATRRYTTLTYAQLNQDANRVATGLSAAGIERGMRAALMVPPSPALFALVFGLYKAGVVPVMIDPGIGLKRLGACLDQAQPQAFIGVTLAHAVRAIKGWGKSSVQHLVTVGPRLFWGGKRFAQLLQAGTDEAPGHVTEPDDIAAILFTSGATGPPKGVVYRHRHFAAQVEMIRDAYGIQPGEVDLPTFPLFALFDPALGMTTVIPRMDFTKPAKVDPNEIIGAVQRFSATNMFGSPALLDTVTRHAEREGIELPTMRRVITAGAPVRTDILVRARKMIAADGCIHTPYGATENLPVASIESREVLEQTAAMTAAGAGVCVGKPDPRNDVRIIAITDEAIPNWRDELALDVGKIGEITVRGPTTTDEYFGRDEATKKAKIRDESGIRHRMGDAGYLDGQGRLWYCGRVAHRVVIGEDVHFTLPIEGVINSAHEWVARSALVGVQVRGATELAVVWEIDSARGPWPPPKTIEAALQQAAQQHDVSHALTRFLRYDGSLPVDIRHNAKIDRPALQQWAQRKLGGTA